MFKQLYLSFRALYIGYIGRSGAIIITYCKSNSSSAHLRRVAADDPKPSDSCRIQNSKGNMSKRSRSDGNKRYFAGVIAHLVIKGFIYNKKLLQTIAK